MRSLRPPNFCRKAVTYHHEYRDHFCCGRSCGSRIPGQGIGREHFTEAETMEELRVNVKEAVLTHFGEGEHPRIVRLQLKRSTHPQHGDHWLVWHRHTEPCFFCV
jgi:hypothetical protein